MTATQTDPWPHLLARRDWARTAAAHRRRSWPPGWEIDDVIHWAFAWAAERWNHDPSRSSVSSYASKLISWGVDYCTYRCNPDDDALRKMERRKMRRWQTEREAAGLPATLDHYPGGTHSRRWLELAWSRPNNVSIDAAGPVVDDDAQDRLEATVDLSHDLDRLSRAMQAARLSERERLVLELRYTHELTLSATGAYIGVSRERARQIEAQALDKVRAASTNQRRGG